MSNESAQPQASVPLHEVGRLKTLVEEITVSLKNQRQLLQMRNIQLPPMTVQTLNAIAGELDKLEKTLVNEQTEIGQLRTLADNAAQINSTLNTETVLTDTMDVIITLTGAERGYIILIDPDTGQLVFRVTRESEIGSQSSRMAASSDGNGPQISQSIVRDVIATGEPMLTDNAYGDERLQNNVSIAALTLRSVLCVPMKYKNQVLGVVYVDNRLRQGVFTTREKNLLAGFANQAAVALENARLYTELQRTLAEITRVKELTDNVFTSIESGVITTGEADRVLTFNRAAGAILQQPDHQQVIGQPLQIVLAGSGLDLSEAVSLVRETHESQVVETEAEINQRGRVVLNIKLSPLRDAQQGTQGVTMVLDDLTEQRERDQQLDTMKRYLPPRMIENIHEIAGLDLGGERREVTCMFVDTRPIASLSGLRPQQVMETVNTYLALASDCISQADGVIDKFMGTEIMGLFNSQLNPMAQHAAQAMEAALLIRDAFIGLYAQLGINPQPHFYRVGIHTGIATLGNVGSLSRRDFTAIGDTINLAKRLEENATGGQIIVSDEARQHFEANTSAQLRVRFEARKPIKAKGREQATPVYEIFRLVNDEH